MSHRRKHVLQSVADECPTIEAGQRLLRVCGPRGGNILEVRAPARRPQAATPLTRTDSAGCRRLPQVEDEEGVTMLVRMPQRFNKMLWVKRGARLRGSLICPGAGRR